MTDPSAGVGVIAALAAGMISFLSPCVLPLDAQTQRLLDDAGLNVFTEL